MAKKFIKPSYIYRVKEVIRVIDGDTADVLIDVGFYTSMRKRLRFLDIDTSELRGGTAETKEHARAAKERLIELLDDAVKVYVKTKMDATGKYGRLLAYLFIEDAKGKILNVNTVLMEEGYDKSALL